jgi:CBS domain-containing protein
MTFTSMLITVFLKIKWYKKEFHAIPVVDNDNLVGIVTTTDLINYLLEQF